MIDWGGVLTHSVWLLGLAVCLASVSYADWEAHLARRRLRAVLGRPVFQLALWTGFALVCAGVALSGGRWWERTLWGVLAATAAAEIWRAGRAMRALAHASRQDASRRTGSN